MERAHCVGTRQHVEGNIHAPPTTTLNLPFFPNCSYVLYVILHIGGFQQNAVN